MKWNELTSHCFYTSLLKLFVYFVTMTQIGGGFLFNKNCKVEINLEQLHRISWKRTKSNKYTVLIYLFFLYYVHLPSVTAIVILFWDHERQRWSEKRNNTNKWIRLFWANVLIWRAFCMICTLACWDLFYQLLHHVFFSVFILSASMLHSYRLKWFIQFFLEIVLFFFSLIPSVCLSCSTELIYGCM